MFYYYFMLSSITLIYALNNDHLGSSSHSEMSCVPPPPPTLFFWGRGKVLFGLIFIFTLLSVKTKFLENFFRLLISVVSTLFPVIKPKLNTISSSFINVLSFPL